MPPTKTIRSSSMMSWGGHCPGTISYSDGLVLGWLQLLLWLLSADCDTGCIFVSVVSYGVVYLPSLGGGEVCIVLLWREGRCRC
jgi:hypothetical protein